MAGFVYPSMNQLEPFTSQHHTEKKTDRYGVGNCEMSKNAPSSAPSPCRFGPQGDLRRGLDSSKGPRRTTVVLSRSATHSLIVQLAVSRHGVGVACAVSSRCRYARSQRLCALRHLEPGIIRSGVHAIEYNNTRPLPPVRTHRDTSGANRRGPPYHSRCRPGGLINDSQQTYMRAHVNSCPFKPRIALHDVCGSVGASRVLEVSR
ncbi:hypothetical protein F5B18DRAFT_135456 [Nemania serpens]|nr:hypothetical protein F5B18DRAFT_135456 [Nemania serpens]